MKNLRLNHLLIKPILFILTGFITISCEDNTTVQKEILLNSKQIQTLIPSSVHQRDSWAHDIQEIMDFLSIAKTKKNTCSIVAIIDQESNFVANPQVPGLGEKAIKEVNSRLEDKFSQKLGDSLGQPIAQYFQNTLKTLPTPKNNYLKQMRKVKTEQDLDLLYRKIFEDMTKHYHVSALTNAAKFIGQDISERMNPITTLGSMQVQVKYANEHLKSNMNTHELRDYLYTQYGGLYYGIHRLMKYKANYSKPIYRFADYNSGIYSSRNAAFQKAINQLSQSKLTPDGDLLMYEKNGSIRSQTSETEVALIQLFNQVNTQITPRQIRSDLKSEKEQNFEETNTYKTIISLYDHKFGKKPPYAIMPEVVISGPKLSRDYDTNWYASRVNGRYETCMNRAQNLK